MAIQRMKHREPSGIRTVKLVDDGVISLIDPALSDGTVSGFNEDIITADVAGDSFISIPKSPDQGLLYYELEGVAVSGSGFLVGYTETQTLAASAGNQAEDIVYVNIINRILENSIIISSTGIGGPISNGETLGIYFDADAGMLIGVLGTGVLNLGSRGYTKQNKHNVSMWALIGLPGLNQIAKVNLGNRPFVHPQLPSSRSFLGTQVNNDIQFSPIHFAGASQTIDPSGLLVTADPISTDVIACASKPRNDGIRQFECINTSPSTRKRYGLVNAINMEPHLNTSSLLGGLVGSIGYSPVTGEIFLGSTVVQTFITNNGVGSTTSILYDAVANTFQVRIGVSFSIPVAIPPGRYYPATNQNSGGATGINFGATPFANPVGGTQQSWISTL